MATKAIGWAALAMLLPGTASAQQPPRPSRATSLRGNPGQFFGADAYPAEAIRNHEQGRTIARLEVGPDGHVKACTVAASSGSASLDQATCDVALAHVTFTPAADETGTPIASTYTLPVRWVLPDQQLLTARRPFDSQLRLEIGSGDRLADCQQFMGGKLYPGGGGWCSFYQAMSPAQLHALRGGLTAARATVTIQRVLTVGDTPSSPLVHLSRGRKLLRLTRLTADVLPDGSVTNARVVEQVGLPDLSKAPAADLRFVPSDGSADKLVLIDAVSVAAAP